MTSFKKQPTQFTVLGKCTNLALFTSSLHSEHVLRACNDVQMFVKLFRVHDVSVHLSIYTQYCGRPLSLRITRRLWLLLATS